MELKYCSNCGEKLTLKEIGDEGLLPYCNKCKKPFFSKFNTCIITTVIHKDRVALIRQNYVTSKNWVLIAGYIKKGDTAEQTVVREVKEETGLTVDKVEYMSSYYYIKKEMLMLGYIAYVSDSKFNISSEVDEINWFPLIEAENYLKQGSIAEALLLETKKHLRNKAINN